MEKKPTFDDGVKLYEKMKKYPTEDMKKFWKSYEIEFNLYFSIPEGLEHLPKPMYYNIIKYKHEVYAQVVNYMKEDAEAKRLEEMVKDAKKRIM